MIGCGLFHNFGILSSYAEDPTLSTIGKGPALLNNSFFVGRSVLMFDPSTHTRSHYTQQPPLVSCLFPFSLLHLSSSVLLLPLSLLLLFIGYWCLNLFLDLSRTVIYLYLSVAYCYGQTWPSITIQPSHLFYSWYILFYFFFGLSISLFLSLLICFANQALFAS